MDKRQVGFIMFGGDYNPDQWDEKTLEEDIVFFKKAHVNTVTLPVFSWARLEPREGEYEFEWLDKILNRLWEAKIHVILATPTSAQPAWMSKKYPDILPVDIEGRKRTHGMRVFFCVNSPNYRERSRAIAKAMVLRYKDFPGLVAWHVANEYGTYCYCESCQDKFRQWLKNRYMSIEQLNIHWHTSFWGRTLYAFDEIMLPTALNDDYRFNPAIQLDYLRFMTDSTIECYKNEADIIRMHDGIHPIFTNISGYIKKLDQFKMVEYMDAAGWDNYPNPFEPYAMAAMKHDIMRGAKNGKSFIVTEQSPNQQNWQPYNKLKKPGELRTLAYQGLAHGADTCLYFQMRQSIGGQEKFHGALISHGGSDGTRIFREATRLGQELESMKDVFLDAKTKSSVGFIFDWENWWALELASGPSKDMDYLKQVFVYYKAFYDNHVSVDFLKMTSELESYKIIVGPLLYMEKEGMAEKIKAFVEAGGTFIATYRTGVVDENDRCVFGTYPGPYKDLLGLYVEETQALTPTEKNRMIMEKDLRFLMESCESEFLCDLIHTTSAKVLASYGSDFFAGTPCMTCNQYGKGEAYYLATQAEERFLKAWINYLSNKLEIRSNTHVKTDSTEIEVMIRSKDGKDYCFVINHSDQSQKVEIEGQHKDVISHESYSGIHELGPRQVCILEKK